ncbi:hypothetical protein B0I35DRAFT_477113 [Stachybotrys elegans]|uniref:Secreted protein n=1 Tax=Stachybotrys elegans TaxID=80388 RepID=A0A8K0SY56_9HYPO|nr:hypothetical protein B0I35DRAFT_477113 [Stachybotrys elegans]
MASRHINLACLIFLLFVAFSSVLEAANLATRKEPRGELGVRLDHHFAVNGRNKKQGPDRAFRWLFSTYIVFKESVADIEPAQLQQIAIDAHQEMRDDIAQYAVDVDKEDQGVLPTVMTILAFDNQIILSSSQKGANGFIDGLEESPVRVALNICRAAFAQGSTPGKRQPQSGTRPDHRYSRKCGEVYAFHHYYQLNKQPLKKRNARVLAVSFEEYGEPAVYVPPCGTDRKVKSVGM